MKGCGTCLGCWIQLEPERAVLSCLSSDGGEGDFIYGFRSNDAQLEWRGGL